MTQQDNGGAAFPQRIFTPLAGGGGHTSIEGGMSLRDYAAIKFMAALISTQEGMANISRVAQESEIESKLCAASAALEFADALLEARSAK